MANLVKELGTYKRMTASGQIVGIGGSILEFICTTAGTLQITEGVAGGGPDIVSQIAVAAATVYPLGFVCPAGAFAVLGTGAAGTFVC